MVVCVLEQVFTTSEQTLIGLGRFRQVREYRQAFQDSMGAELRKLVEEATGRKVVSFLSQVSREGVASEVFVLERAAGSDGEARRFARRGRG